MEVQLRVLGDILVRVGCQVIRQCFVCLSVPLLCNTPDCVKLPCTQASTSWASEQPEGTWRPQLLGQCRNIGGGRGII